MESIRTGENWRESWWVKNTTKKTITVGDLQLLPAIAPGKRVDVLHYYTRERISHATTLLALIKSGKLQLNKQKLDANSFPGVISPADAADAVTPAEENEVQLGGSGVDHTHDNLDTLDGFDEDSSGLLWNGQPIQGVGTEIHNDLIGLQGGDVANDEYYHVDYDEYNALTGGPDSNADAYHTHDFANDADFIFSCNVDGGWPSDTFSQTFDGGSPSSTYVSCGIDGGVPASCFCTLAMDGGFAGSTY